MFRFHTDCYGWRTVACLLAIVFGLSGGKSNGWAAVAPTPARDRKPDSERLDVSRYMAVVQARKIRGVFANASGLTFNPESRSLFVVINSPPRMVEMDLQGKVTRSIRLAGFEDTEGIVALGQDRYGILDERRRHLCVVQVKKKARSVKFSDLQQVKAGMRIPAKGGWYFLVDERPSSNLGLEGLTYDQKQRRFFIVKEKNPRKFFQVSLGPAGNQSPTIQEPWKAQLESLHLGDLSGVHFHEATQQLLIISHESRSVVQCALDGRPLARLSLAAGSAGLSRNVPQAEGVTMDDQRTLYIVSEPNLLYVFKRPSP